MMNGGLCNLNNERYPKNIRKRVGKILSVLKSIMEVTKVQLELVYPKLS